MVEEKDIYKKTKAPRPKAVYHWTTNDVIKWMKRHCNCNNEIGNEAMTRYAEMFIRHDITGRSLLRLNDNSLYRIGITDDYHRDIILKEILKQRLKKDIMEIKDLEHLNNVYQNCS